MLTVKKYMSFQIGADIETMSSRSMAAKQRIDPGIAGDLIMIEYEGTGL
jgi:hypothetical protein